MPEVSRKDGQDEINTNHGCDAMTVTKDGSQNVFVNNIGAVRKDDLCEVHTILSGSSCVPHQVPLSTCSSTVFVNNKGVGRKGDFYNGHELISGSGNVFAGG
jgi:uncharacterized Zn-binding protein involved in type VI secretion